MCYCRMWRKVFDEFGKGRMGWDCGLKGEKIEVEVLGG